MSFIHSMRPHAPLGAIRIDDDDDDDDDDTFNTSRKQF